MAAELPVIAMDTSNSSGEPPLKDGFYRIELNKTVWEVPVKYQDLTPIGSGAYGSVW